MLLLCATVTRGFVSDMWLLLVLLTQVPWAHAVPIYVVAHSDHYLSHVVNGVLLAVAHAVPSTCAMYQYLSHVVNGVLLAVVVATASATAVGMVVRGHLRSRSDTSDDTPASSSVQASSPPDFRGVTFGIQPREDPASAKHTPADEPLDKTDDQRPDYIEGLRKLVDLKPSLTDAQYEKAIEQYQQEYSQKKGPIEHQVALPPSGAAQVLGDGAIDVTGTHVKHKHYQWREVARFEKEHHAKDCQTMLMGNSKLAAGSYRDKNKQRARLCTDHIDCEFRSKIIYYEHTKEWAVECAGEHSSETNPKKVTGTFKKEAVKMLGGRGPKGVRSELVRAESRKPTGKGEDVPSAEALSNLKRVLQKDKQSPWSIQSPDEIEDWLKEREIPSDPEAM